MLLRRALPALLAGACAARPTPSAGPPLQPGHTLIVIAESWHTEICLPAHALDSTPLAPVRAGAPSAAAFSFGFGLESWMRAGRPGLSEGFEALTGGVAVVSIRALRGAVPPGAEEVIALRLPPGGVAAIAAFVAGQMRVPVPPSLPPGAGLRLVHSVIAYSLRFSCNTWVVRALAEAGLPVRFEGIVLRRETMAAVRAEALRQAGEPGWAEPGTPERQS
jgi:hypothetical protein